MREVNLLVNDGISSDLFKPRRSCFRNVSDLEWQFGTWRSCFRNVSNLEWQFETCGEFVLGISLWLCELSGLESLWN